MGDLRATVPPGMLDDVMRAVSTAADAIEAGDSQRAIELLRWAKDVASRSAVVRESLGIAYYQAGAFEAAYGELLAYRRLTGRADQNHLLADCARAIGKPEKTREFVDELLRAQDVGTERKAEGLIVLAGQRADRGDLRGAIGVLERAGLQPAKVEPWHPRVWYAAADLYERAGELDTAREYFEAVLAVDEDFLDAGERLASLEGVER